MLNGTPECTNVLLNKQGTLLDQSIIAVFSTEFDNTKNRCPLYLGCCDRVTVGDVTGYL